MSEKMTVQERDAFLREPRLGVLSSLGASGAPVAVPLWFEWDGAVARFFTSALSPKVKRLEADPRVSLLVANPAGEDEAWVAIDGRVELHEDGAIELAERLAERYWDTSTPNHRETLELWRRAAAVMRRVEIHPTRIRSYRD